MHVFGVGGHGGAMKTHARAAKPTAARVAVYLSGQCGRHLRLALCVPVATLECELDLRHLLDEILEFVCGHRGRDAPNACLQICADHRKSVHISASVCGNWPHGSMITRARHAPASGIRRQATWRRLEDNTKRSHWGPSSRWPAHRVAQRVLPSGRMAEGGPTGPMAYLERPTRPATFPYLPTCSSPTSRSSARSSPS